jgi:hypothetical protein
MEAKPLPLFLLHRASFNPLKPLEIWPQQEPEVVAAVEEAEVVHPKQTIQRSSMQSPTSGP